ncbi:MAG: two-component regulator propeller domain-containing protein [Bacteroidota bacterium]
MTKIWTPIKKQYSHFLALIMPVLFALNANAQGNIEIFNTNNSSLVSNNISAIDYDSHGNVWIGTSNGISVYQDGNWTTYTSSNSGLISNSITALLADSQDNIWIGTYSGLSKYDGSNWTSYTTNNSGISNNSIRSLAEDNQGNIWMGTSGNGVDKYNGSSFTNYNSSDGLAHDFVQGVAADPAGNMWFGTSTGVSKRTPSGTWTTYDDNNNSIPAASANLNDLTVDSAGHVWGGASKGLTTTGGGVPHYDQNNWEIINSQNSSLVYNEVKDVAVDGTNAIWFATDGGGVSYFDYQDNHWVAIKSNHGLPNNNCMAVGFDIYGNTWIGTDNGLAKITPLVFQSFDITDVSCDTVAGSLDINHSGIRNDLYFSIDSGLTYQSSPSFSNLMAGSYPVIITDSLAFLYAGKADIVSAPIVSVNLGPDTSICQGENITLNAGSQFLTYLWNNGLTQQSITVDGSTLSAGDHTFYVTTEDSNYCATTDTIVIEVKNCTSVPEYSLIASVSPNPAQNKLNIKSEKKLKKVMIFTSSGQLLIRHPIENKANSTINLHALKPGFYWAYIISTENKTSVIKFIKK